MANPWGDEPVNSAPEAPTPPASVNPWGDEPVAKPGFFAKAKSLVTGEGRIDPAYAEQPEFTQAYAGADYLGRDTGTRVPGSELPQLGGTARSQIAPDEAGQLDILRKQIPGLEEKRDQHGNLLLKAPGMKDFAYLNKPGLSGRDVEEFGTQTLATLPFMGAAGAGKGILARIGYGAGGMAAGSVAQDALAGAAGSEQGISGERAAIGGAVGAALPGAEAALKAGGALASYPINQVRKAVNPDAAAERAVKSAVAADLAAPRGVPLNTTEIAKARAAGQDVRVLDTGGEAVKGLARSAANQSPEARAALMNLIDERYAGQGPRTAEFIRSLVARPGQNVNAYETREALQAAARAARTPLYETAYKDGAQGIMDPILTQLQGAPAIERAMRAAAGSVKNRAAAGKTTGIRGPNGYTLEFWDLTKRSLDDRIGQLKKSGAKSAAMELSELRTQTVKALDNAVPSYAPARGTAQSFFKAGDALEAGENFVGGRYDITAARRALAKMTQQERELFAEGFASKFIGQVRGLGDRRDILNSINASPAARERFNVALGPNRARAMEAFLRVEDIMDSARKAMGNSTTVRQMIELGLTGYGVYNADPHTIMLAALSYGNRAVNRRVAERVAQQLLSNNPQQFMQGLKQIGSTPMLDSLRAFDKVMKRVGGGREAAEGLSSPNPAQLEPPMPEPRSNSVPGVPKSVPSAPPDVPSVGTPPGRQASLQGAEEARRMAEEAIARGAPRDQVEQRLAQYLRTNGLA